MPNASIPWSLPLELRANLTDIASLPYNLSLVQDKRRLIKGTIAAGLSGARVDLIHEALVTDEPKQIYYCDVPYKTVPALTSQQVPACYVPPAWEIKMLLQDTL